MDIHPSALKHGVAAEDVKHAVRNAMAMDYLDDDLYPFLGPDTAGSLLEVLIIDRGQHQSELAIQAMPMRPKYRRLLPGERS